MKKINVVIMLMASCTLLIFALQLYWNYNAYSNTTRVFKSDINDALDKAVGRLMDERRDTFAAQYKKLMADTSTITISCVYSEALQSTIFYIRDRDAPKSRPSFSTSINDLKQERYEHITPAIRREFIDSFVKNMLYRDLKSGVINFYTQHLGENLLNAFKKDRLDTKRLEAIYREELAARGINNRFSFSLGKYVFKNYSSRDTVPVGYSTRAFKYGFSTPQINVSAKFQEPGLIFLQRMKWVLLSSVALIGITIFCFRYTVKTMLSQQQFGVLKDDFVNNMTHELKTPVATISIAAEAIQDFNVSRQSAQEYIGIIRDQSGNLTNLIDQILRSRVNGQAALILDNKMVPVHHLVSACLRQYQPQLIACNAVLKYEAPEDEYFVKGDRTHLANVIGNLLDNAIKYGSDRPEITLTLSAGNDIISISVSNDGQGIPAAYQKRVFERFFRVPNGNRHDVKGYGLGLSYAMDVVSRHSGSLTCLSKDGLTIFTVELPLAV